MQMVPVASSNIANVGYEQANNILAVDFIDGGVYYYIGVPPSLYDAMLTAPSIGKFFASYIKGSYEYTRTVQDVGEDSDAYSPEG